jgi:hypothetical protein
MWIIWVAGCGVWGVCRGHVAEVNRVHRGVCGVCAPEVQRRAGGRRGRPLQAAASAATSPTKRLAACLCSSVLMWYYYVPTHQGGRERLYTCAHSDGRLRPWQDSQVGTVTTHTHPQKNTWLRVQVPQGDAVWQYMGVHVSRRFGMVLTCRAVTPRGGCGIGGCGIGGCGW